jgi:hypothetical protein
MELVLNRTPVFLDYGLNLSLPWLMGDQMLSYDTRAVCFQHFIAVTPGTETFISGFCTELFKFVPKMVF